MKALAEAWESYRQAVLPADIDPLELERARRAFYAGALSRTPYVRLTTRTNTSDDEPEDELTQYATDTARQVAR